MHLNLCGFDAVVRLLEDVHQQVQHPQLLDEQRPEAK